MSISRPSRAWATVMLALSMVSLSAACGGRTRTLIVSTTDAAYPYTLTPPERLRPDVEASQTISVEAGQGEAKRTFEFDAVLQKRRDTLLVIGLGPMNTRAFTIEHRGERIVFEQFMGPPMAISPRTIVVDIQRVFFSPVARAPHLCDGEFAADVGGERVTETWQGGALRRKTFAREGGAFDQPIVIEYAYAEDPLLEPLGCLDAARATNVTLTNPWLDYVIFIENRSFERI